MKISELEALSKEISPYRSFTCSRMPGEGILGVHSPWWKF